MNFRYEICTILFTLSLSCLTVSAQHREDFSTKNKSAVKLNVVGAAAQLYSGQFEQMIGNNLSVSLTGYYREKRGIPFGNTLNSLAGRFGEQIIGINFEYVQFEKAQVGVKGISPEVRYYFGRKESRPFLSIYAHAEKFDLNIPSELDILFQDKVYSSIIPIDFAVQSTSAGIMLGYQFRKGKWGVDWTILGPRFGYASSLFAQANQSLLERLSDSEKEFVIDDVYAKYRLNKEYFLVNIDGSRAEITNLKPIPIGIIRGFGLNIFRYF
ncbi:MAG: DUF3575 domain-containing protein [Spirosomataceae bacterium]